MKKNVLLFALLILFVGCQKDKLDPQPNYNIITYYGNGGVGESYKQVITESSGKILNNKFSYDDYAFVCWNTKKNGSGINYYPNDNYYIDNNYKELSLYATWSSNYCEITFDANGGEGSMISQKVLKGQSTTLNPNEFTRDGFIFKGWNTKPNGNGLSYNDNSTIYIGNHDDEIILYAQWEEACVITFYANGSDGVMEPQLARKNSYSILNENTFTRQNYVFIGWNTKDDGSGTSYQDKERVYVYTDELHLYAQWAVECTITFMANGGTGTMNSQKVPTGIRTKLKPNTFIREDYAFNYWTKSSDGNGTWYNDETYITINDDITLYANWRQLSTVTINMQNGTKNIIEGTSYKFYDSGGISGNYSNNEDYSFNFNPPTGKRVKIEFLSFNTEDNYDYITINGQEYSGHLYHWELPTLYSNINAPLNIQFHSDGEGTKNGWSATVTVVD